MSRLVPRIFVDFDGTIMKADVGNEFFRKFGNEQESLKLVEKWKKGELSGRDLLLGEAAFVRASVAEATSFVEHFEMDRAFPEFVGFCKSAGLEVSILSDGLDFYISRILTINNISPIEFYSNVAHFHDSNLEVTIPYESDCKWCANCKGNQILTHSGAEDAVVYIGNGFSDRCAVKYADMVFAKDELLKYCEENNITYFPFETFDDVLKKFRRVLENGGIRKRHRAELNRKEAYLSE